MAKKSRKKAGLTVSSFKTTGAHAKLEVDDKKQKTYYFKEKVKLEEAKEIAEKEGASIFGVSASDLSVSKPKIKYEFYCIYDLVWELQYLSIRKEELSVNDHVKGALVGGEILKPNKGKTVPGKALKLPIVELYELKRTDSMIVDGRTGGLANQMESLLTGPGKKKATPAWIRKAKVASGKANSIDKVIRQVSKTAKKRPKGAKRVVENQVTFKKLMGFYVPVWYVRIAVGEDKKTLRINAVNEDVGLDV
ncbi:MAG: conserved exported protein of unknown function [Candidatus Thorarchaeota archaeon]|nr:MAG: conserved exported protein of unknown function [Candidatus Thorarchaeota archaeon]